MGEGPDPVARAAVPASDPKVVYQGRFLEVVEQPYGGGTWEYLRRRGGMGVVFVFAITPQDEVLLVRQFRIPLDAPVWELPAGVGDQAGEDLIECGLRELVEETGWRAARAERLITSPVSSGSSATLGDIILALDLQYVGRRGGDEFFPIEVVPVPIAELVDFILARSAAGELVDSRILAALCLVEARGVRY